MNLSHYLEAMDFQENPPPPSSPRSSGTKAPRVTLKLSQIPISDIPIKSGRGLRSSSSRFLGQGPKEKLERLPPLKSNDNIFTLFSVLFSNILFFSCLSSELLVG
jgi:hypothetical protein